MLRIRLSYMEDQRLLASVALFRKLYDNQKDSYDVLADFIRAAININSLWNFTVDDCSKSLKDNFGFKVPTAVLKSCLKRRLKDEVELSHGNYGITLKFEKSETLESEMRQAQAEQEHIILDLIEFVASTQEKSLSRHEEQKLRDDFHQFFLGGLKPGSNHVAIGKFILSKSKDDQFTRKLNHLEEGVILYQGIEYSPDNGAINSWRSNYTIYLDTEILFWANGYDGVLFETLFKEFFELVREVNLKAANESKILLKYFPETKQEVDSIFSAAEHIFKERRFADPSRTAMQHLLSGCKSRSDIIAKRGMFYSLLDRYKISEETDRDYYNPPYFNCESNYALAILTNELPEISPDKIANTLKFFTKINYIRQGVSHRGLEQSKAILVSGKNLSRQLAWHPQVMHGEGIIPFSTDLDFLTERLWFKLGKGFGGNTKSLVTFDVVARAQIILSTQVSSKISGEYRELIKRVESGQMQTNDANYIISELKAKAIKPEELNQESVAAFSDFLDVDSIEAGVRARRLLEDEVATIPERIADHDRTIEEFNEYRRSVYLRDLTNWRSGREPIRKGAKILSAIIILLIITLPTALIYRLALALSTNDTLLSQVGFVATILALLWSFVSLKLARRMIKRAVKAWVKKRLRCYTPRPKLDDQKTSIKVAPGTADHSRRLENA